MNISGVTFIKNGLSLGYPIKESILSIEPLCDEIIINVGFDNEECTDDDGTYEYLQDTLNKKKFIFIKNFWDTAKTSKGLILSEQTNLSLQKAQGKYCQYIQGDEVISEKDLGKILQRVKEMELNSQIEGLIFDYIHFYGNIDIVKQTRTTYRREVRLIKNHLGIKSWLDAQGFRHKNGEKLRCKLADTTIYHYGWAREKSVMRKKIKEFNKLYHGGKKESNNGFSYQKIWGLKKYEGEHPQIMQNWIEQNKNNLEILNLRAKHNLGDLRLIISDLFEGITGYRIGEYKNYKLI